MVKESGMTKQWLPLTVLLVAAVVASPARAKNSGLIFVSNEKSNSLIVLDPRTFQVVKDIKVSRRPRDMHFNTDHTRLYVACRDDNVIDIIDVARLEVVQEIATGPNPETFAIDEMQRRVYVPNKKGASLSIIDIDQNIIVKEVPTSAEPEGAFVSEDRKTVYMSSLVDDTVDAIDVDEGYLVQRVAVGTHPRQIAVTPDGRELWVTAELSANVYIINRTSFSVDGKIEFLPLGTRKTDVSPLSLIITKDGKTAYVALREAGQVAVVDVVTRKIQCYIPMGRGLWGIALSPDEARLYVTNDLGDSVMIIDVNKRQATISIPTGRVPKGVIVDD
jgi:PQQ-dependent catabolism-associated beta-propeller protein